MLEANSLVLLIIDVQGKLSGMVHQKERILDNMQRLIKGIKVFEIPVMITEQYPQGLGATLSEITGLLPEVKRLPKISFSCCGDDNILRELKSLNRKQVLISGIESHVCVYQTAVDLVKLGFEVYVVTDTISSREPENRRIAFYLMNKAGATLTSTETVLFELLKIAKGEKFKAISQIVK
jgi:nicotinamidase-related amidase